MFSNPVLNTEHFIKIRGTAQKKGQSGKAENLLFRYSKHSRFSKIGINYSLLKVRHSLIEPEEGYEHLITEEEPDDFYVSTESRACIAVRSNRYLISRKHVYFGRSHKNRPLLNEFIIKKRQAQTRIFRPFNTITAENVVDRYLKFFSGVGYADVNLKKDILAVGLYHKQFLEPVLSKRYNFRYKPDIKKYKPLPFELLLKRSPIDLVRLKKRKWWDDILFQRFPKYYRSWAELAHIKALNYKTDTSDVLSFLKIKKSYTDYKTKINFLSKIGKLRETSLDRAKFVGRIVIPAEESYETLIKTVYFVRSFKKSLKDIIPGIPKLIRIVSTIRTVSPITTTNFQFGYKVFKDFPLIGRIDGFKGFLLLNFSVQRRIQRKSK